MIDYYVVKKLVIVRWYRRIFIQYFVRHTLSADT